MTGRQVDWPALVAELAGRGLTVATAESLTGGLLAATLTEVPGASAVVRGGLVVYATDLKARLAGVPTALLERAGPVDPDVAVALARGARQRCAATIGIGLTGVAGPQPQAGVTPGVFYVAVATDTTVLSFAGEPGPPPPSRVAVRAAAVQAAGRLLIGLLDGQSLVDPND